MAEAERKGSRLGRTSSVVLGFGGGRQGGNGRASTSVLPASGTSEVDGVSAGEVPSNEEDVKLLNQALARAASAF